MRCDDLPIRDILIAAASDRRLVFGPSLWGYGGLHGGLALAILASSMRREATGDLSATSAATSTAPRVIMSASLCTVSV
jgi:hypothetical protein